MLILLFIDSLGAGGAQKQLVNLGKFLVTKGHDVHILAYHNEPFYNEFCNEAGITVILPSNRYKAIRYLKCMLVIRKYNHVISFLEVPNFLASIAVKRTATLIASERNNKSSLGRSLKERVLRKFLYRAKCIVTNSETNRASLSTEFSIPQSQTTTIYNSLCHPFSTGFKSQRRLSEPKFLVVASFQEHKNQMMVLRAMEQLRDTPIEIHFFGGEREGGYLEYCRQYAIENDLSKVHFRGEVTVTPDTYHEFSGLIHTSMYEGMPNVVIEALSEGLDVIVTPVSDLPALLDNTSNTLVKFDSENDLAQILLEKLKKFPLSINQENIALTASLFDADENFTKFHRILLEDQRSDSSCEP